MAGIFGFLDEADVGFRRLFGLHRRGNLLKEICSQN